MSAPANNLLVQVITYQRHMLAAQTNYGAFLKTANTAFDNFQDTAMNNLGNTVSFTKRYRQVANDGLIVSFEPIVQRVQTLTVDQSKNIPLAYSSQQFIFNKVDTFMKDVGMDAVMEIGAKIESNIAFNAIKNTYRYYGDGKTPISNYSQLTTALANFRNYGMPQSDTCFYVSDMAVPSLVNTAVSQFVPGRNEKLANSWDLGRFDECDFYRSNLLNTHIAGTVGNADDTLTVTSVVRNSAGQIVTLNCSGATAFNDPNAIKQYDKATFQDNVGSLPNLRYLTWQGHEVSQQPVQVNITAASASDGGGNVVLNIYPPLQAASGGEQNLNTDIQTGMQLKLLPNHRAGLITAGNPLFVAMPMLPNQEPFATASAYDDVMGVSTRLYTGWLFGQNTGGTVYDVIWGSTMEPEYAMMVAFPM